MVRDSRNDIAVIMYTKERLRSSEVIGQVMQYGSLDDLFGLECDDLVVCILDRDQISHLESCPDKRLRFKKSATGKRLLSANTTSIVWTIYYQNPNRLINGLKALAEPHILGKHGNRIIIIPEGEDVFAELRKQVHITHPRVEDITVDKGPDLIAQGHMVSKGVSSRNFADDEKFKLVGESEKMKKVRDYIIDLAQTSLSVLIMGESGTGKEVAARMLHKHSARAGRPFVIFNCASFSPDLAQSTLFGHVKGAFSGAVKDSKGLFQEASGGTLFLDEIGDLPLQLQPIFLRALEDNKIRRVGGQGEIQVDVRLVAATNRNLEKMIAQKAFRADLYYRLEGGKILMPPLREHREDIPELASYYFERFKLEHQKPMLRIDPEVFILLFQCDWSGNVRELKNELSRVVAFTKDEVIDAQQLSLSISKNRALPISNAKFFLLSSPEDQQQVNQVIMHLGVERITIEETDNIERGNSWVEWVRGSIHRQGSQYLHWVIVLLTEALSTSLKDSSSICRRELDSVLELIGEARYPPRICMLSLGGELPEELASMSTKVLRESNMTRLINKFALMVKQEPAVDPPILSIPEEKHSRSPKPICPLLSMQELVRDNFDKIALAYARSHRTGASMQSRNAVRLLTAFSHHCNKYYRGVIDSWLDIGCGTGLVMDVALSRVHKHDCGVVHTARDLIAIDVSPKMVAEAQRNLDNLGVEVLQEDILDMTPNRFISKSNLRGQFDLITANNVFHWFYTKDHLQPALNNCAQLLKPGGILAATIAAQGTGTYFFSAYKEVMEEVIVAERMVNWATFIANPIGLQSFEDIVQMMRVSGLEVIFAESRLEPVEYGNTGEYVDDARTYGDAILMAPVADKSSHEQESVWKRIRDKFYIKYNEESPRKGYTHDQYMIYILACRRS